MPKLLLFTIFDDAVTLLNFVNLNAKLQLCSGSFAIFIFGRKIIGFIRNIHY